jgi:Family of unknown function (DUF5899)
MIEVALLLGLGAVGYLLAVDQPKKQGQMSSGGPIENFTPRPTENIDDGMEADMTNKGHNNEVPYFGANKTQSMYSGATNGILDSHTGAGKEYFQKSEVKSFFDAKPATGNPFGNQNESDFMQSRMVTGQHMNNTFPIDQVHVGPGANDGYTNIPKGGFQQDQYREYALPRTTDEVRVVTKPKLSYEPPVIPGSSAVTQPGIQADVNKNRPDRFAVYGMDRVNTAVGAQTATRYYPEQIMKTQARESTSKEYFSAGGNMAGVVASYVRAFTEPYQEFMKLTTEGRPGPAGAASGTGQSIGADMYSAQTNKDETVLSDAARFNSGMVSTNATAQHLGSYTFNAPLKQDVYTERNGSEILTAFNQNPYSQKLNSF